ncbi:MAG TPA: hypothetical protein VFR73_16655 [Hyphomicrobiaceae bacterium]|nr:hypothetical protein [Hyphomicrobiaceae bacterium]
MSLRAFQRFDIVFFSVKVQHLCSHACPLERSAGLLDAKRLHHARHRSVTDAGVGQLDEIIFNVVLPQETGGHALVPMRQVELSSLLLPAQIHERMCAIAVDPHFVIVERTPTPGGSKGLRETSRKKSIVGKYTKRLGGCLARFAGCPVQWLEQPDEVLLLLCRFSVLAFGKGALRLRAKGSDVICGLGVGTRQD